MGRRGVMLILAAIVLLAGLSVGVVVANSASSGVDEGAPSGNPIASSEEAAADQVESGVSTATEVVVSIDAPDVVAVDSDFVAKISASGLANICLVLYYPVSFDESVLQLDEVTAVPIGGKTFVENRYEYSDKGDCYYIMQASGTGEEVGDIEGISGSGYLAKLHFHVIGQPGDTSNIGFSHMVLTSISPELDKEVIDGATTSVTVVSVIPGDANGDGRVNVLDLAWTARIIAGLEPDGGLYPGADANGDGRVNVLDLAKIARIIAGLD